MYANWEIEQQLLRQLQEENTQVCGSPFPQFSWEQEKNREKLEAATIRVLNYMRSVVHVFCVEKMYGVGYEKHHIPLQIRDAIDERLCHEQFGEKNIWN